MAPVSPPAARVTRAQRERLQGHRGGVVYMTGLSGAGKSTLAARAELHLHGLGLHTTVIDGDDLRGGLCRDLGFSDEDRVENMRRATEVARPLVDAGLVVLSAMISPFRGEREVARRRFAPGDFLEVFVDAPLAVCEARDPKGLYARARRGDLPGFTGIDSRYEPPARPELHIDTARDTVDQSLAALLDAMRRGGFFD